MSMSVAEARLCGMSRKQAAIHMYCLPCAGGSADMYRDWDAAMPDWIAVCPVELPGRGRRFGEDLCSDAIALAGELVKSVLAQCERPFVLFGHSMGALLAHEMALQLAAAGRPQPAVLILSGREPPHCRTPVNPGRSQLPADEFLRQVRRYGGLSTALEESRELQDLFLPVLRNDFSLVDSYRFEAKAMLACPLLAVGGDQEPDYAPTSLLEWEQYSQRWAGVSHFAGGHFYLNDPVERRRLLDCIRDVVVANCSGQLAW